MRIPYAIWCFSSLLIVAAQRPGQDLYRGRIKRQYGPPRTYSITESPTPAPEEPAPATSAPEAAPTDVSTYQGFPIPESPPIEAADSPVEEPALVYQPITVTEAPQPAPTEAPQPTTFEPEVVYETEPPTEAPTPAPTQAPTVYTETIATTAAPAPTEATQPTYAPPPTAIPEPPSPPATAAAPEPTYAPTEPPTEPPTAAPEPVTYPPAPVTESAPAAPEADPTPGYVTSAPPEPELQDAPQPEEQPSPRGYGGFYSQGEPAPAIRRPQYPPPEFAKAPLHVPAKPHYRPPARAQYSPPSAYHAAAPAYSPLRNTVVRPHFVVPDYAKPYPEQKQYTPQYRKPGRGEPGKGGFIQPWQVPAHIQQALHTGLRPGW